MQPPNGLFDAEPQQAADDEAIWLAGGGARRSSRRLGKSEQGRASELNSA